MNYSELLQLAKGWGNFVSDRINIWRLRNNKQDHQKNIFHDSVNKNYKAGDSDLVDYGHSREK